MAKSEIPACVEKMNGKAVVKVPFGNCGVGVYTICNQTELDKFLDEEQTYDKFLVQSLVGDISWFSNKDTVENYFHVGTLPNENNEIFVYDLRMVVTSNENGFRPVSINGRRARKPMIKDLSSVEEMDSWEILGTNLSVQLGRNSWDTECERLIVMNNEDFGQLGIGLDDLIDGFVQTVLAVISIDKFCERFVNESNELNYDLIRDLNTDVNFINEI